MKLWLAEQSIARHELGAWLGAEGFVLQSDPPFTYGSRHSIWGRDQSRVTLLAHARSGCSIVALEEVPDEVAHALRERWAGLDESTVMARSVAAVTVGEKLRTLYMLSGLARFAGPREPEIDALLLERLLDAEPLVRWATWQVVCARTDRAFEQALGRAAAVHPEFVSAHAEVAKRCQEQEDGTIDDHPTDSWFELYRRAREGVRDGKWKRVVKAMDALLGEFPGQPEAQLLRALAHEHEDELLVALALLGAAHAEQTMKARVARNIAAENEAEGAGRGEADEAVDAAEAPEVDVCDDALLVEIRQARARLHDSVAALGASARAAAFPAVLAWLERWSKKGEHTSTHGAALALLDVLPEHEGLLALLAGSYDSNRPLLERALGAVPDSALVLDRLGHAWSKQGNRAAAEAAWRAALARVRSSEPKSEQAELIDRVHGSPSTEGALLEALTRAAYEAKDWDEAAGRADELVVADQGSQVGWQMRANARTFALRHAEAATAYEEALGALDRIIEDGEHEDGMLFGGDPRPGMHFNHGCVLTKLGRKEEALAALRRAMRADEKWVKKALEDDYLEALFDHPEFQAMTRGELRALALPEEREPAHIDGLIWRAMGLSHRGEHDKAIETAGRAADLAEAFGHTELLVRALVTRGRAIALHDNPEVGVELLRRAVTLAEPDGAIDPKVRANAVHELGLGLLEAKHYDKAEAAYLRGLELRKAAYGEDDPTIAKSYGELSRLAAARDEPEASIIAWNERAIEVLERFLARRPRPPDGERDDDRAEALFDLATVRTNLARSVGRAQGLAEALEHEERALQTLETVREEGYTPNRALLDNEHAMLGRVAEATDEPRVAERARQLQARIDAMLVTGDAAERQERLYWLGLRRFVARMRAQGVSGETLADVFSKALRGGSELPPDIRAIPEVGSFAAELARRAEVTPTLIAMVAMALETAGLSGELEDAFENLEGLCVAAVLEAAESG